MLVLWAHEAIRILSYLGVILKGFLAPDTLRTKSKKCVQVLSRRTQETCFLRLAVSTFNVIELSLIAIFHPVTLLHRMDLTEVFPPRIELCTQLLVFFVIDGLLHRHIFERIMPHLKNSQTGDGSFRIAADFMTPRATVIVAMGFLGSPTLLGAISGRLHFATIVIWMALRQVKIG